MNHLKLFIPNTFNKQNETVTQKNINSNTSVYYLTLLNDFFFFFFDIKHFSHFCVYAIKGNTFSVPLDENERKNCETVYAESFHVITTASVIYFLHKMFSIPHFSFNLSFHIQIKRKIPFIICHWDSRKVSGIIAHS